MKPAAHARNVRNVRQQIRADFARDLPHALEIMIRGYALAPTVIIFGLCSRASSASWS